MTLEPLDREDWAGEDCFYDDEKVDYVSELDDDERRESIEDFQDDEDPFFSGLFTPGDADTIVFKGKDALMKVHKEWISSIKREADDLVESEILVRTELSMRQIMFCIAIICSASLTGQAIVRCGLENCLAGSIPLKTERFFISVQL